MVTSSAWVKIVLLDEGCSDPKQDTDGMIWRLPVPLNATLTAILTLSSFFLYLLRLV